MRRAWLAALALCLPGTQPAEDNGPVMQGAERRVRLARVGPTTEAERLRPLGEIDRLGLSDLDARADVAAEAQ